MFFGCLKIDFGLLFSCVSVDRLCRLWYVQFCPLSVRSSAVIGSFHFRTSRPVLSQDCLSHNKHDHAATATTFSDVVVRRERGYCERYVYVVHYASESSTNMGRTLDDRTPIDAMVGDAPRPTKKRFPPLVESGIAGKFPLKIVFSPNSKLDVTFVG